MPEKAVEIELRFDHVARQVPDVAAAVAWYQAQVPQTRVLYADETWAFIDAAGTKLAFVRAGDHPDHVAWRVADDQLDALAERYGKTARGHRDGTRSFYVTDPSGHAIEFISYPSGSIYTD
jgi:catechol 2,3-dioxygenase-like lactoylglutathione lyase family enzyme